MNTKIKEIQIMTKAISLLKEFSLMNVPESVNKDIDELVEKIRGLIMDYEYEEDNIEILKEFNEIKTVLERFNVTFGG